MRPRALSIVCIGALAWATACVSVLPDDPAVLPQGPVQGLIPTYLTEADARVITLEIDTDFLGFVDAEATLALDSLRLWVDTIVGVRIGVLDSFGRFEPRALLRVPGIMTLAVNAVGQLTVGNHGDRVTGRLAGLDRWDEELREVGAVPPAPTYPLQQHVRAARGAGQPGRLIEERYFECFDESRGLIGGWDVGTITGAPCLTSVFE